MKYNPKIHRRRSIRLKNYDYSQKGAYFVTICTQDKKCLFGNIQKGKMGLNEAGKIIEKWWRELEKKFPSITLDASVIMPNHFHGIIVIGDVGEDLCVCPSENSHIYPDLGTHAGAPLHTQNKPATLSEIIQWFKTMTTNEYIRGVKSGTLPSFEMRLYPESLKIVFMAKQRDKIMFEKSTKNHNF